MKILVVDISGKVINYDIALCNEMVSSCVDNITYMAPIKNEVDCKCAIFHLISLIPSKYQNSKAPLKRGLKAVECLLNYFILCIYLWIHSIDVVHFQWLPFLEIVGIESYIIQILKFLSPKTKYILTIHNIYPHNSSNNMKERYKIRFCKVKNLIDSFIVHTEISKADVIREFGIEQNAIDVVYHGIFVPNNYRPIIKQQPSNRKWNLIMYGNQSPYKGTDIFIKALGLLPEEVKPKVRALVCGKTDKSYLNSLQSIQTGVEIIWKPYFVEDSELFSMIDESDVIILPYRAISQSGVLLLALYFRRVIITSDLPSFKETLKGFSDELFSEAENPASLASVISNYVRGEVDIEKELKIIENLNEKYSWEKSAVNTLKIYQKLCKISEKCQ